MDLKKSFNFLPVWASLSSRSKRRINTLKFLFSMWHTKTNPRFFLGQPGMMDSTKKQNRIFECIRNANTVWTNIWIYSRCYKEGEWISEYIQLINNELICCKILEYIQMSKYLGLGFNWLASISCFVFGVGN